jgi:O-acetyl-ADP-ribose deacetylase (regulator of RNase III)
MEAAVTVPPEVLSGSCVLRLLRGDITELDVDAFVFYAQPDLALGSGFGGAIAVRGGASIQKALSQIAAEGPIPTGKVVVTEGGKLKARYILHAVGPRFREPDTESKLRETILNCLVTARERGLETLAFPLMGSGYYGIPNRASAQVMMEAFKTLEEDPGGIREIRICVFDTPQFDAVQAAMAAQV